MYLFPADILTAPLCQHDAKLLLHLLVSLYLVNINRDYRPLPPVKLYEALLLQDRICLIYRMHIDTDCICQLTHRRKSVPLPEYFCCNSHNDLMLKLDIDCFTAVKIYLNNHIYSHLFCYTNT